MHILLRSRTLDLSSDLKEYVRRRAAFALDRLTDPQSALQIALEERKPARGASQNLVTLQLSTPGAKALRVTAKHAHLFAAIDDALGRAGRSLARRHARARTSVRPGHRPRISDALLRAARAHDAA